MLSPEIQLFNAIFKRSQILNYTTVHYKDMNNVIPYPFVHVGETTSSDVINNKEVITGNLAQTIHVWGMADNRALFADMVFKLKRELRALNQLDNYYLRLTALDSNNLYDNTATDNLLHGVITAEYKLS